MAQSIRRLGSLLAISAVTFNSLLVEADQVQHPVRFRINPDVLRTLFARGDQRMLDAFANLKLSVDEKNERCPDFSSAVFSMTVNEDVDLDTYDFDVSIKDADKDEILIWRSV